MPNPELLLLLPVPFNGGENERDILHIQPLSSMLIRVRATHCEMQQRFHRIWPA